ncbi:hypothetical protein HY227_02935 [Candidatus Wolfebacteria bacterium]|nr:hypothetical protein [Candidatus Wolfebacteria bacterium]
MAIEIIKKPVKKDKISEMASRRFGDWIKAVVDTKQEIMAIGGELHADMEVLLTENEDSKREYVWGINIYPENSTEEMIEFNSMINLKPALGNRSRGVENPEIREKIKEVVKKLIID